MKPRSPGMLCLLFGLACCAQAALAMPKAAENEEAQVSHGADVARPKQSAKPAKPQVGGKSTAGAKGKRAGAASRPRSAKVRHATAIAYADVVNPVGKMFTIKEL
jgi:hypothetical protein